MGRPEKDDLENWKEHLFAIVAIAALKAKLGRNPTSEELDKILPPTTSQIREQKMLQRRREQRDQSRQRRNTRGPTRQ